MNARGKGTHIIPIEITRKLKKRKGLKEYSYRQIVCYIIHMNTRNNNMLYQESYYVVIRKFVYYIILLSYILSDKEYNNQTSKNLCLANK